MMKRLFEEIKPFLLAIGLIILVSAVLLSTDASNKKSGGMPRVAIVQHASQASLDAGVDGIIEGLAQEGFIDGSTMMLKRYNAQADLPTANDIALQVTNGSYDLVITASTVSMQAVANANKRAGVKHVFGIVTDATSSGVGISATDPMDHPPYMVGISSLVPVAKALKRAQQANPGLRRLGLVWHTAEINSQIHTEATRKACKELGIELLEANAENAAAVGEAARSLVARGVDALFITGDVVVLLAAESVVAAAKSGHIPVFTVIPPNYKKGTLFDEGADYVELGHDIGHLAGQVIKGLDIAKVPHVNKVPEKLTINLTALDGLKDKWTITPEMVSNAMYYIDKDGEHDQRDQVLARKQKGK